MRMHWRRVLALVVLSAGCPLRAGAEPARDSRTTIDHHLRAAWRETRVTTAPADDAEFLRRVYVDLAGRIPSVPEARAFFGDRPPGARERLVDHLLDSPRYATH